MIYKYTLSECLTEERKQQTPAIHTMGGGVRGTVRYIEGEGQPRWSYYTP